LTHFTSAANNIGYETQSLSAAMSSRKNPEESLDNVLDIREYDVPYYVRVAIDLGKDKAQLIL
jgi:DNA polymerase epsilon subunit 1